MRFFDSLIASNFGQTEDGGTVFYPHGPVGRRYSITPEREAALRAFLRRFYVCVFAAAIFAGTVLTRVPRGGLALVVIFVLMLAWYEIRVRRLLRGDVNVRKPGRSKRP